MSVTSLAYIDTASQLTLSCCTKLNFPVYSTNDTKVAKVWSNYVRDRTAQLSETFPPMNTTQLCDISDSTQTALANNLQPADPSMKGPTEGKLGEFYNCTGPQWSRLPTVVMYNTADADKAEGPSFTFKKEGSSPPAGSGARTAMSMGLGSGVAILGAIACAVLATA